ncbi:MAG TPA: hypothetical protein EYP56_18365 [Planctomycetaceae bacterium]|nr:hypothetical protein [Planctomycetaceae bacterium]HIQ22195.1 hypothetical protein [Planctomycetota bacterium]
MTKAVAVPLDSYKVIEHAQPIACFICNEQNNVSAPFCRHCQAPLALAHQAATQKSPPRMVAVVGATGVGKTVYLGMLVDMLSRRVHPLQILARGAFSITLQQTAVAALAQCRFPEKTPNEPERWNWVHCQIRRPRTRRTLELIVPDMSGEAILEEVEHPHTTPVISAFLKKCCATMILVDAARLDDGLRDQEYFSMKFVSYLAELDPHPKTGWAHRPVAVVLTKADRAAGCRDDPEAYARSHAAGLWQQCSQRLQVCRFFAAGVAGGSALCVLRDGRRVQVPLRVEPHGIVEPFDWLLERLNRRKPSA